MNEQEKKRKKHWLHFFLLDTQGVFLVYYTVWLANFADWGLYNLSVVGYWMGKRVELIAWGLLVSHIFCGLYLTLCNLAERRTKAGNILCLLTYVNLIACVFFPYQPWKHPVLSEVHIVLAMTGPVCMALALGVLLFQMLKEKEKHAKLLAAYMGFCILGCVFLFLKYEIISSYLEVFAVACILIFMNAAAWIDKNHGLMKKM